MSFGERIWSSFIPEYRFKLEFAVPMKRVVRGEEHAIERRGAYEDVLGFCFSASLEDIKTNDYVLTPGRFVGTEDEDDDGISFDVKFISLKKKLAMQFTEGDNIRNQIEDMLREISNDE